MLRCLWCHQSTGDLRTVVIQSGPARQSVSVHPEHEALVIDWHDFAVKHQASCVLRLAMLPLALLALIGLASLVSKHLILVVVGIVIVWIAATLWQFPFATPQTVSLLGIRRSVALTRGLAGALGLFGALLAGAGWWLPVK